MRKPFDVLAEGFLSRESRGDWTPLELFIGGVAIGMPGSTATTGCEPAYQASVL
jgi:hypothetical protein